MYFIVSMIFLPKNLSRTPSRLKKYLANYRVPLSSLLCYSGVARVPCALGQDIFLRPPSTKLTEFELKYRCKRTKTIQQDDIRSV